jgi:type IV pilus assembly protein PilW
VQTYFDATLPALSLPGMGPTGQTAAFLMSPRFMLLGHECDGGACVPALNAPNRGFNRLGPAPIPAMGTAVNQRGVGADVLTLRYFSTVGALVENQIEEDAGPAPAEIVLANDAAALAREGFSTMAANDPIWVSDCSTTVMFRGTRVGARNVRMSGGNFDNTTMLPLQVSPELVPGQGTEGDARAFHIPTSLRTVSYYLQIKNDPKQAGRRISSLMRKVDGDDAQELVEGVERFDLLYGVQDGLGRTRYLTAAQVDALAAGSQCVGTVEPGCGWRSVKSIEAYLLVNTVDDISPTGTDEFRYSWLNTGVANAAGTFENPVVLGTLRNGLPPGRMLRREFRTTISLRVNNF